jgi:phosphoserine aminotransferase
MSGKRAGEDLAKEPTKPTVRPVCANFGSGPCAKRPGWSLDALAGAALGRSHRSALSKGKLEKAITQTKELLPLPLGYEVGIVPASDTGAVEMVMWSMLGPRPVDLCHWEHFGSEWFTDAVKQLQLKDVRDFGVNAYGECPNLSGTNSAHDIVFTFNGTTSGGKEEEGISKSLHKREGRVGKGLGVSACVTAGPATPTRRGQHAQRRHCRRCMGDGAAA